MLYLIYKITNQLNGKIYIGKHQTFNPDDCYFGSGVALINAIKLHGKENFKKEVLFSFDSEQEMNLKEKELITEEFVSRSDTYNLGVGGEGGAHFKGKTHSPETKAKIAESLKGRVASVETRKKHSAANTRRFASAEARAKQGSYTVGRIVSAETRAKISASVIESNRRKFLNAG